MKTINKIMKTIISLFILILFFGCKKTLEETVPNTEKCKTCTTTVTYYQHSEWNYSSYAKVCGSDTALVNGRVNTFKLSKNGIAVTVTSKTTCE